MSKPIRKSPYKSATLYKEGTKKIGLDGNIWIIKSNSNGIKKWVMYKKNIKEEKKDITNNFFCQRGRS